MKKIEPYFLILFVLALVFKHFHWAGADLISIFTFSSAALFYYALTLFLLNKIDLKNVFKKESYANLHPLKMFTAIALGWDFSILILGIFFKFMLFPGGELMLTYGLISQGVFFLIFAIFYKKKQQAYFKMGLFRILIIGSLGFIFQSVKADTIIDLRYGAYPEYAKAVKAYYHNPSDKDALKYRDQVYFETFMQKKD